MREKSGTMNSLTRVPILVVMALILINQLSAQTDNKRVAGMPAAFVGSQVKAQRNPVPQAVVTEAPKVVAMKPMIVATEKKKDSSEEDDRKKAMDKAVKKGDSSSEEDDDKKRINRQKLRDAIRLRRKQRQPVVGNNTCTSK